MTYVEGDALKYDQNTPQTAHPHLAAEMYATDFFAHADGTILNVAAGHTDLDADLRDIGIHKQVVAVDPLYAENNRYIGRSDRVPATADAMPFSDEFFSTTLCHYGMQHIADKGAAIREMVRVTQTADSIHDASKGTIIISPVFRPKDLTKAILGSKEGLALVSGTQDPPEHVRDKAARSTLIIKKTADLSDERLEALIQAVETTSALDTRRSLGELASRVFKGYSKY